MVLLWGGLVEEGEGERGGGCALLVHVGRGGGGGGVVVGGVVEGAAEVGGHCCCEGLLSLRAAMVRCDNGGEVDDEGVERGHDLLRRDR